MHRIWKMCGKFKFTTIDRSNVDSIDGWLRSRARVIFRKDHEGIHGNCLRNKNRLFQSSQLKTLCCVCCARYSTLRGTMHKVDAITLTYLVNGPLHVSQSRYLYTGACSDPLLLGQLSPTHRPLFFETSQSQLGSWIPNSIGPRQELDNVWLQPNQHKSNQFHWPNVCTCSMNVCCGRSKRFVWDEFVLKYYYEPLGKTNDVQQSVVELIGSNSNWTNFGKKFSESCPFGEAVTHWRSARNALCEVGAFSLSLSLCSLNAHTLEWGAFQILTFFT